VLSLARSTAGMARHLAPAPEGSAWAPLPSESEGEYAAFLAWLYARHEPTALRAPDSLTAHRPPKRSLDATARYLRVSPAVLATLAKQCEWDRRARAFDDFALASGARRVRDSAEDRQRRLDAILSEGEAALSVALSRLTAYLETGDKTDLAALRALRIDLPRLLDTVATHRAAQAKTPPPAKQLDLSRLTDDELDTYEALLSKASAE